MEKAVDDKTVLMYVCNPNNPTGTTVDAAKLKAFCERVSKKVPVFVDEAYIDYMDNPKEASVMECVKKGHNVMVARTFSKLYGFAGLRVGYMVAQPAMLETMKPLTKGARSISATSGSAALASYQDTEFLQAALKKTTESKEYLYSILKKHGYDYIPSSTNFVLFPIKMEGKKFTEEMMNRGVSVRFWKFSNKEWCRVSIGLMDEMKVFEEAFTQIA
jgi:histidinol-phosphate aminotransferase